MLSIERLHPGDLGKLAKYRIISIGDRDHGVIAVVDGLKPAACVLRFLKGAHLQPQEYQLAMQTMAEIDARERMDENAG